MSENSNCPLPKKRAPWNKGKLIGARPPLRPKQSDTSALRSMTRLR
jgi:hypothetical protein